MKVKKYQAENMQEAILKVKSDLGPNAIILHSRKFKKGGFFGFFAKKMVEVVATIDSEVKASEQGNKELKQELNQMKGQVEELVGEVKESQKQVSSINSKPVNQQLVEGLLELGVSYSTARKLAQKVGQKVAIEANDLQQVRGGLKEELKSELPEIEPIKLDEGLPKVVALVGPTGVGKTTTLAKLAANFSLLKNKKVGLITADTYRIAAVDQLKTYSEIIDLPLEVVFTPQELKTAIEGYQDYDLILIDTAGRSQNNEIHISELKGFIKKTEIDEVYLVLSSTTKAKDLEGIIDVYSQIQLDKLILTKIDETDALGVILEAVNRAEKPISYITTGQDVPEDIEVPQTEELINNLVEGLEL